jgi:myo-inositol-1(or 4)-monophosphatase
MPSRLQIASRAARAAGELLHRKFDGVREIHSKGNRDIVTDADYASDRLIRALIHKNFPGDYFLSEEDSAATRAQLWAGADRANGAYLWVVDPLDGTANYAHRIPAFAVSIGLYRDGAVRLGVVYDPVRDELFAAEAGRGATLNGKSIQVGNRGLGDAVIGLEFGRKPGPRSRTASALARILGRVLTARSTGSAAISMCYVAAGRFDIYYHLSLSPWDVAAAAHIVEEAGGRVTTVTNQPWSVHSQTYLATNGKLHAQALRYFK